MYGGVRGYLSSAKDGETGSWYYRYLRPAYLEQPPHALHVDCHPVSELHPSIDPCILCSDPGVSEGLSLRLPPVFFVAGGFFPIFPDP